MIIHPYWISKWFFNKKSNHSIIFAILLWFSTPVLQYVFYLDIFSLLKIWLNNWFNIEVCGKSIYLYSHMNKDQGVYRNRSVCLQICIQPVNFKLPEPKAQVRFSDRNFSIVLVVIVVVNFSHFHLLQNHLNNFHQSWHKHLWVKRIQVVQMAGLWHFQRGDNNEIQLKNLKISSSGTTGSISIKLGTKHPCVKGSKMNEGPHPFARGDNNEIAKVQDVI